jgi:hypothetical protein
MDIPFFCFHHLTDQSTRGGVRRIGNESALTTVLVFVQATSWECGCGASPRGKAGVLNLRVKFRIKPKWEALSSIQLRDVGSTVFNQPFQQDRKLGVSIGAFWKRR